MEDNKSQETIESTAPETMTEELRNAFADSLTKPSNVFESPSDDSKQFVRQPFFQEQETEEVKDETTETVDTTSTETTDGSTAATEEKKDEVIPPVSTETQTQEQEVEVQEVTEPELVGMLNEALGDTGISTLQDIKALIEENKQYKEAKNQLKGLTKEERARIEVGRETGDFSLYDRVIGIEVDKLSDQEAIKQQYFLERLGKNPLYLEKSFNKYYIDQFETDPDEDYNKLHVAESAKEARSFLNKQKADFNELGKINGEVDVELEKQNKLEADKAWFKSVDDVLSAHDRVIYNLDGSPINIVMDAADRNEIQDAMDKPADYLKQMITNKDGQFDHKALFEFVMWAKYKKEALDEAFKLGAAKREEQLLKEKKNVPGVIKQTPAGSTETKVNVSDKIAQGLVSMKG